MTTNPFILTETDCILIAGATYRGLSRRNFHRMVRAFADTGGLSFEEGLDLVCMGDFAWSQAKYPPIPPKPPIYDDGTP